LAEAHCLDACIKMLNVSYRKYSCLIGLLNRLSAKAEE